MATKIDTRQTVVRELNPFIGNTANEQLNTVLPKIDAELAKLFEDRNILLTDGGVITFTGTQLQFTENLNIVLNQKISGAAPQVISLGSSNVNFSATGRMWYVVIDRSAGTATQTTDATTMPSVVAANQEVFLIAKRVDAGDGTQRVYWRTGMALNAGQSVRLGSSGSGTGGSGVGDDLDSLLFRASFRDGFDEGPTATTSAVDATANKTDATLYSAAKAMYTLNYDAAKTIAASTTTTNINISAVAAFTVKIGDFVIANNQTRRITAVATQASFTTEAFSVAPTLAAQVTISQGVYTKDIYNLAVDGVALSAAFSGATFQDVLVDYEDTTTAGDNIFDVNTTPVIAFSASADGTTFTDNKLRATLETDTMQSFLLPAAGTGLFMRFVVNKTSGTGTANVLGYRAFMQKSTIATAGGITNSSYAFTNGVGTPVNATLSVVGGKTTITLPWSYAVGVYSGTSASSIEVWLNGAKLPRFINSTLTPDGSFLETSSSVVTLDRDYSLLNLSVEIFQRTQIVDSSTQNTTNIAAILASQFKNSLFNSAFDFWQRGTSVTVANTVSTYQADRWYVKNSLGTSGVITYSRVAGTLSGSLYGASVKITTAPTAAQTNGTELYQTLENLDSLQYYNQTASFGINIKALGNVTSVGLQFFYNTSEAKVNTALGSESTITVNSSSFTFGQLLAQTIGALPTTAGVIGVRVRILGVSSGNTYDLNNGFVVEQGMMNLGFTVASYSKLGRSNEQEFASCQRYYELFTGFSSIPGYNNVTTNIIASLPFRVPKRTAFWSLVTSAAYATNTRIGGAAAQSGTSFTAHNGSSDVFGVTCTITSTTISSALNIVCISDSDFIGADAEI